jgi:Ca-activated chloride channel homolog
MICGQRIEAQPKADCSMRENIISIFKCLVLFFLLASGSYSQTRPRQVGPSVAPSPAPGTSGVELEEKNQSRNLDPADVLKIDTTLVTVPVSVRDRSGKFIVDLQPTDFEIFENGIQQQVAYFATMDTPFTVVLVLDTSASTWSKLGQIRDAAKAFVDQLPPEDQVMVTSFGMGLKIQCEATSDRQKIRKAIDDTNRGLSTHLYDAMHKIMDKYLERLQGRKAIVLFTDGVDATSNHETYESNIKDAEELDALIYSIRYDTYDPSIDNGAPTSSQPRLPGILGKIPLPLPGMGNVNVGGGGGGGAGSTRADYERGQRYLEELAELTGGQVYEASKDLRYLRDAFSQIAAELSRQYSIGYYPMKKGIAGERRLIKVRVTRPEVAVRARPGYVYKDPTAANAKSPKRQSSDPTAPVLKKQPFARSGHEF